MSLGFNSAIYPRNPSKKHYIPLDCWPSRSIQPNELLPPSYLDPYFSEINLNRIPIFQQLNITQNNFYTYKGLPLQGIQNPEFLNFAPYPSTNN